MLYKKIIYLIIAVFMYIISILYNKRIMMIIFLTLMMLPFAFFAISGITALFIRISLDCKQKIVNRKETDTIDIKINNRGIFPVNKLEIVLLLKNKNENKAIKKKIITSIAGRSKKDVKCSIKEEHCGIINIRIKSIRCFDCFLITSLKIRKRINEEVIVFPIKKEIILDNIMKMPVEIENSTSYSKIKSGDDSSEIFNIRKFIEGDRIQKIHWKLSYKTNELMVKEYSLKENKNILILIEFKSLSGNDFKVDIIDKIMDIFYSLGTSLCNDGEEYMVAWYDDEKEIYSKRNIQNEENLCDLINEWYHRKNNRKHHESVIKYLEIDRDKYSYYLFITGEEYNKEKDDNIRCIDVSQIDSTEVNSWTSV